MQWLGIWDTGKTLGLNEEKLGFIGAGGETLPERIDEALNTVQFDVSRRQKLTFTAILSHEKFGGYTTQLRTARVRDSQRLQDEFADDPRVCVRVPTAGTFALVNCEGLGADDQALRHQLLARDVGVIAGRVFFHVEPIPRHLIRIALARGPRYFSMAISRLRESL